MTKTKTKTKKNLAPYNLGKSKKRGHNKTRNSKRIGGKNLFDYISDIRQFFTGTPATRAKKTARIKPPRARPVRSRELLLVAPQRTRRAIHKIPLTRPASIKPSRPVAGNYMHQLSIARMRHNKAKRIAKEAKYRVLKLEPEVKAARVAVAGARHQAAIETAKVRKQHSMMEEKMKVESSAKHLVKQYNMSLDGLKNQYMKARQHAKVKQIMADKAESRVKKLLVLVHSRKM